MPTPLELALHTLLPTQNYLPPELLALTSSLLSQSRNKVPTLKADEEVGRTFVCSHIACERLETKLGLELGKVLPPVKPRVYAKLKKYLDGVLETPKAKSIRTTAEVDRRTSGITPKSRRLRDGTASQPATPAKDPRTSPKSGTKRKYGQQEQPKHAEAPAYAMKMIRALCKALDANEAALHVYTGLCVVLQSSRNGLDEQHLSFTKKRHLSGNMMEEADRSQTAIDDADVPAVIVLLFMTVCQRLYGRQTFKNGKEQVERAAREFCQRCGDMTMPVAVKENGDFDTRVKRFSQANETLIDGWKLTDWYESISVEGSHDHDDDASLEPTPAKPTAKTPLRRKEKHGSVDELDQPGPSGLAFGLGTMFQPPLDWLSDDRRAEYANWKSNMMERIAAVERNA